MIKSDICFGKLNLWKLKDREKNTSLYLTQSDKLSNHCLFFSSSSRYNFQLGKTLGMLTVGVLLGRKLMLSRNLIHNHLLLIVLGLWGLFWCFYLPWKGWLLLDRDMQMWLAWGLKSTRGKFPFKMDSGFRWHFLRNIHCIDQD